MPIVAYLFGFSVVEFIIAGRGGRVVPGAATDNRVWECCSKNGSLQRRPGCHRHGVVGHGGCYLAINSLVANSVSPLGARYLKKKVRLVVTG